MPGVSEQTRFLLKDMTLSFSKKIFNNPSLWLVGLVVFAVTKPTRVPNINRYIGMGVWFFTVIVFVLLMFTENRYRDFWRKYRREIILIASLLGLHLVSMLLNLALYPDFTALVFYGFAPLAVFSLFVMVWSLFRAGGPESFSSAPPILFLLIHCLAMGQFFHYETFRFITGHTIAADIMHPGYITSVFPHHTIYGTIAAVNIIYGLNLWLKGRLAGAGKYLWFAIMLLALVGGALSHSRNFLWTLGLGMLAVGHSLGRQKFKIWMAIMALVFVLFHVVAYNSPMVQQQYGRALPYLGKLAKPQEIAAGDFIPSFSSNGLTGRPQLWGKAVDLWQESPLLGRGPGSFNLSGGDLYSRQFNVHCFYLQILLDTGVVGAAVLLLLLGAILKQAHAVGSLPVLIAVMASLVFDNFLDHSMAWSIIMAWFLQPCLRPETQNLKPITANQ